MAVEGWHISLDQAAPAEPLTVVATVADSVLAGRLANLGWRVGRPVTVVRRTVGGGRVIDLDGGRIALSRHIAQILHVETRGPVNR